MAKVKKRQYMECVLESYIQPALVSEPYLQALDQFADHHGEVTLFVTIWISRYGSAEITRIHTITPKGKTFDFEDHWFKDLEEFFQELTDEALAQHKLIKENEREQHE